MPLRVPEDPLKIFEQRRNLQLVKEILEAVRIGELRPPAKLFFNRWYDVIEELCEEREDDTDQGE